MMNKSCALLCLILALTNNSWSQVRVALLGGPQSSSIKETNNITGWDKDYKPFFSNRNGGHVGFLLSVPLNKKQTVFFQPAFLYSSKGNKYFKQNDTTVYKAVDSVFLSNNFFTSYIEVPLNLAYRVKLSKKAGLLLSAGPYVSFFYNGEQQSSTRTFKRNLSASPDEELANTLKTINEEKNIEVGNGEEKAKTIDVGYNIRAGLDIGNVLLTGFYSEGLTSMYSAKYPGDFHNRVIGASLGIWLNKLTAPEVKTKDRDNDGVPDKSDKCPDLPGLAKYLGCPATDTDNDGVADETDKCPGIAGLIKYNGCPIPDTDGDGVNDELDKCPQVSGLSKYNGCPVPDTDEDGVDDEKDKCPAQKGPARNNGCPIPDTDGDGVNDEEDACPAVKGIATNKGCPEIRKEVIEKVNYAAKHITFKTGSDVIQPGSFKGLDEVVAILKTNPVLRLSIEGHSDNTGTAPNNLLLSERRAIAVSRYFASKGIAGTRLTAKGFGQEKPIADNTTKAGQSANRRVEMHVVQE